MRSRIDLLIDGDRVPPAGLGYFRSHSPVLSEAGADVAAATTSDARRAVDAAARAFETWSSRSFGERRAVLLAAALDLENHAEDHAHSMALETGATAAWAGMNVAEAAATLREAAGLTSATAGEVLVAHDPRSLNLNLRVAAGVVLAIIPWNAPLVLAARSIAIALALGNTVVIRPSEQAPEAAGHILADALIRAGIDRGAVNVLSTDPEQGGREVIADLIADPRVRRVVFIGSTAVGRQIARLAGEHLTPAVLELGGKNPTVVLADAEIDATAQAVVHAAFANTGQVCMATDRIIVHDSVADELLHQVARLVGTLRVGDPRETSSDLGPLINERAAEHYRELVGDATRHGAVAVAGAAGADGLYVQPVVLDGVSPAQLLWRQEAFSPVASIHRFTTDAQAAELANDTEYGLIASVFSGDPGRALNLAARLRTGAVHINGSSVGDEPHVPFGGVGASGLGRLGGQESIRSFTDQRTFYAHGLDLLRPASAPSSA